MPTEDGSSSPTASAVQQELDALAIRLGRSVSLDDPSGTLLGYSIQDRDVDTVRVAAILTRRVPDEVLAYQRSFGVDEASGPVRVPANPELQMTARLCLPVRRGRRTLALLWLLDDGTYFDAGATRAARSCADRLGALISPPVAESPTRLLARLFADDPPEPLDLLDLLDLLGNAKPRKTGPLQFVVLGVRSAIGASSAAAAPPTPTEGVLATAAVRGRRLILGGAVPRAPAGVVVGRSATFDPAGVDSATVATLAAQAIVCADCAATDPALPQHLTWEDLGLYRRLLLTTRPDDWPGPPPVPEHGRSADMLRHTLEVYLDHAGDAARSITTLHIHRTTFYYRLERLTRLYGINLDSGLTRTEYHLALKTRRLAETRDRYGWTPGFLERLNPPTSPPA